MTVRCRDLSLHTYIYNGDATLLYAGRKDVKQKTQIDMKRIALTFLTIFFMLETVSLHAWGPKGHDVVAAIAEQNLTCKAKKNIRKLLGNHSIVYYSSCR